MKKYRLLVLVSIMFFFYVSCTQKNDQKENKELKKLTKNTILEKPILEMLNNFYVEYITECSKDIPNDNTEFIIKKYVTNDLIKKIDKLGLDFDPFINAQDCDSNFLRTFKITKDKGKENVFIVTYTDSYSKSEILIRLSVVESTDGFKISDIEGIGKH